MSSHVCSKYLLGSYIPIALSISLKDHIQLQKFCQLFLFPELVLQGSRGSSSPILEETLQSPQRRLPGVFFGQDRAMPKGHLPLLKGEG